MRVCHENYDVQAFLADVLQSSVLLKLYDGTFRWRFPFNMLLEIFEGIRSIYYSLLQNHVQIVIRTTFLYLHFASKMNCVNSTEHNNLQRGTITQEQGTDTNMDVDGIRKGWQSPRKALLRNRLLPSIRSFPRNLYAARVENRYLLIYAESWEFNILGASGARAAADSLSRSRPVEGVLGNEPTNRRTRRSRRRRKTVLMAENNAVRHEEKLKESRTAKVSGGPFY